MRKLRNWSIASVCLLAIIVPGISYAQSCSSDYCQQEDFMGSGGSVDSTSGTRDAIGDTGVGASENGTYDIDSGYVTDAEPRLIFIVDSTSVDFGDLSTTAAATGNTTFKVLNYNSSGYVVQTFGDPPSSGSHVLDNMATTDASQVGVEQFGINLRANTSPIIFGADPVQVPSSDFSNGGAAGGYSTANNFRYVQGETVAAAAASSGETDYTVSYIVNVSTITPGGKYQGQQGFICVGTY